jgi:hypothetical protein
MTAHLQAQMISSSGPASASIEKAISTVERYLCKRPGADENVYAIVFRSAHDQSTTPDHMFLMDTVRSTIKNNWHEVSSESAGGVAPGKDSSISVVEINGVKIYRGCTNAAELQKNFSPEEGIYILPAHVNLQTVKRLGLEPLSEEAKALPTVFQVAIDNEPVDETATAELDRESRAWRENFINRNRTYSAPEVAEEAGNRAKNTAALASRWAKENRIFSIRFQNQTLYPAFQFKDGEPIPVIAQILRDAPPAFTGWDFAFFFTTPNVFLEGKCPLQLLKSDPDALVPVAHAFTNPASGF